MHKYSIKIPNTKMSAYKVVTAIVLFINAIMFIIFPFDEIEWKHILTISGGAISILGLADFFRKSNGKKMYPFALFANAVIWVFLGKYWIGLCMLLFAGMAVNTLKDLIIRFSDDGIVYPSFPEKKFPWNDVAAVLLKDDILTIDLKNNQLFQFTLLPEEAEKIEAKEFNEAMRQWVNESIVNSQ